MKTMTRTIAIVALLALASCTTAGADRGKLQAGIQAAAVCGIWSPLSYDGKLDTQLTKDQIRKANAKRNAFCAAQKETK